MDSTAKSHIPLSRIQKLIGQRMLKAKRSKPCFYIESRADVTELMALRHQLSKSLGVKITSNTFFVRALAIAAGRYPLMVGRLIDHGSGDDPRSATIRIAERINVGFAVNSPQGLVVPVVKDADAKTLAEIASQEKILTDRARSNKLTLEEIEGETIALSNLGVYGIDSFLGIVPPPASTILAVGNVVKTLVPADTRLAVRKMMSLSLAVDHRIINSDYAAQFLQFIIFLLQEPGRLI